MIKQWKLSAAPLLVLIYTVSMASADVQVRLGTEHFLDAFAGAGPCDGPQPIELGGTHVTQCSLDGDVARISAFIDSESNDRGLRSLSVFSEGTTTREIFPGFGDVEIFMRLSLVLEVTDSPVVCETTLAATGFDPDGDFFSLDISNSDLFDDVTFPIDPSSPFAAIGTLTVGTHNIEIVIAKSLGADTPPTMNWELNIAFGPSREMHWINPAGGLFGEPSNWLPSQAPSVVEHTAIFDFGGLVPVDFTGADKTAGQLLVRNTTVDLFGGRLFLRAPTIAEPSLAIGKLAQVVLHAGEIRCENAVVGDLFDPTAVAALELLGSATQTPALIASGTVLVGVSQTSRLSVTDAKLECNKLRLAGAGTGSTTVFSGPKTHVSVNSLDMDFLGPANLIIGDGAEVLTGVIKLVGGPLGVSSLTVDGFNAQRNQSSLLTAASMSVDEAAHFEIRAGGQVQLERLTLGSDDPASKPRLTVTGRTQSTSSQLTVVGLAKVLGADTRVTVSEKAIVGFEGDVEIRSRGRTSFEVIGPDTACAIRGTLTIAATSGAFANVDVSEGGVFSEESGHADAATLRVGEGVNPGSIRITHPIERFNDPVPSQMRFKNIEIANGSVVVQGAGALGADQTITVRDLLEVDSNLLNRPNVFCNQLNIKATGVVRCCPSGRISATTIVNEVGARIEGDANITGNVVTSGLVRVGCSPGTMTIEGDYEQTAEGVLEIEVAGLEADQFDVLKVTGNATLAGTVDLRFIDSFVPRPGDSVDFVQVDGTIIGQLTGSTLIDAPGAPESGQPAAQVEVKWEVTPEGTCRMTITNVTTLDDSALLLPAECGAGLCGTSVVPLLPLTLAGIIGLRLASGRHRRRRSSPSGF